MTDTIKIAVLQEALRQACSYIRRWPPADMEALLEDSDIVSIFVGGKVRDPKGEEYMNYFLLKAMNKIEKGE